MLNRNYRLKLFERKYNCFVCLLILIIIDSVHSNAQEIFSWGKEKEYCNPSVIGLPRAKAVVLKYELQTDYKITSKGGLGNYGNSEGEINRNHRFDLRVRFPIINKPSITIAAGIKYSLEEFRFENDGMMN